MEKTNCLRGIAKMALGFFIVHTAANIYFAASGNFPPMPKPSMMPGLTPSLNIASLITGLIVVPILIYTLYLGKNKDKFSARDILTMLAGIMFIPLLIGVARLNIIPLSIGLISIIILSFFSFKK
jgi:hypothetical protein